MPKITRGVKGNGNKFKGNKGKKRKTHEVELDEKEDYYALVLKSYGGNRIEVIPENARDDETVSVMIPGRMFKKTWFNENDIIVVTGNKENGDVIKGRVMPKQEGKVIDLFKNIKKKKDNECDEFEFEYDFDNIIGNQKEENNITNEETGLEGEIDFSEL